MRILVAQKNPTIGDMAGNTQKILASIHSAKEKGADIVLFSELALCGYPPEDLLLHPAFVQAQQGYLEKIAAATRGIAAIVGTVRCNSASQEKPLFNSAAVLCEGKIAGFADKQLLPTYDVFDERRYFEPGTKTLVWEFRGKKIAILICEDIWQHAGYEFIGYTKYARDPVEDLKKFKIDLVLNLSSSPYQFQRPDIRRKVCAQSCKALHCPVILCCQVGGNDQLVFDGYSLYLDAQGRLCQVAKGFEEDEMLIDLSVPAKECAFAHDDVEDLYRALVLGVRDYMHKLGFKRGCLGLSGGIDSALVACIAVDALGKDNVLALSMPSRYSSEGSVADAQKLAENLRIELLHISIEPFFQTALDALEPFFQGKPEDVAEENIQARMRGIILMAISNKLDYILLSTGNKSEMAMGYCTLYGDMAGGLSVISDVTKQQVYALAHWLNRKNEVIPRTTIEKVPSAELKFGQKDTDTLPDYAVLDKVLQGYVEDFLPPEEIAEKYQLPIELVVDLIHRIHRAEYKRRQAPPGIRVSKKAFRVGRRYPIVQKWM
ncbi:MAG TPA: NAD+ synthase [Rhabdochlamydiaceae bacterium]|jgi:NAD+ synthase (glutamine-hydrolysing)